MFSKHRIYPDIDNIQLLETIEKNVIFQEIKNAILESLIKNENSLFLNLEIQRLSLNFSGIFNFLDKRSLFNFLRNKAYMHNVKNILKNIIKRLKKYNITSSIQYDSFTYNYELHLLYKKSKICLIIDGHYLYNYLFKSEKEIKRNSFILDISISQCNKILTNSLSIFSSKKDHLVLHGKKSLFYFVENKDFNTDLSHKNSNLYNSIYNFNAIYDFKNNKGDDFFIKIINLINKKDFLKLQEMQEQELLLTDSSKEIDFILKNLSIISLEALEI